MTSNLRSTYTLHNGIKQEVPEVANLGTQNYAAYYYVNGEDGKIADNGVSTNPTWGLLYSWAAANVGTSPTEGSDAFYQAPNGLPSDRQGICPAGWVVPSDWDQALLEKEIATNPQKYSSQTNAYVDAGTFDFYTGHDNWRPATGSADLTFWGRQMKSTTAVTSTNPNGASIALEDGRGFNALLVGFLSGGVASNYGTYSFIWSSSSIVNTAARSRGLASVEGGVLRYAGGKPFLFSVRCKKTEN
jgi:uncharacterized protein (TIGR02145 family)